MKFLESMIVCAAVLAVAACTPKQSLKVEKRGANQFLVTASGKCMDKELDAYWDSSVRALCKGDYRVIGETRQHSHMWGSPLGECVVPEHKAFIECLESKQ